MSKGKSVTRISQTTFIVGLIIAILASSLLSTVIATQWAMIQGPKGDKGDPGPQGLRGPQGEQGPKGEPGEPALFESTYGWATIQTNSLTWVDMDEMSVNLTLSRTSHLLLMFSVVASAESNETIYINALVGGVTANPGWVWLTPEIIAPPDLPCSVGWGSYTYNFYLPFVFPGTYTVKIQWSVSGGTAGAGMRTLTVIALPA